MAGVQFECLTSEGRILLRHSISSLANAKVAAPAGGLSENEAVAKSEVFGAEPAAVFSNPEPETRRQLTRSSGRPSNGLAASFVTAASQSNLAVSAPESVRASLQTKAHVPVPPRILERRPEVISPAAIDSRRASLWLPVILPVSLLLTLGFFGLSRHRRAPHAGGDNSQTVAASAQSSLAAPVPNANDNSTAGQALPNIVVVTESIPGIFLQAGAMKDEGNADALVRSLQQKKFPAFLLKKSESRFYRVLVGPYPNAHDAFVMQVRLQEQGFHTIPTRRPSR
jgi:cell division septation protein DedD